MTAPRSNARKLTDDDVIDVLLAPEAVSNAALARRIGVSVTVVRQTRRRLTKHALIVARRLGLLPLSPARGCWAPRGQKVRTATATHASVFARTVGGTGPKGYAG